MTAEIHVAHLTIGSANVVRLGTGKTETVITHQAHCDCGWNGPRRTAEWEAEDDITHHLRNPSWTKQ